MRVVAQYDQFAYPPVMRLYVHGAPHRRHCREVLQRYREDLTYSVSRQIERDVDLPIDHPIDLDVVFVNPSSPDLDHLLEALYMALDGKSLKGPALLTDDRMIQSVKMSKYYATEKTKRDGAR